MKQLRRLVAWTYVTFATERTDRYRVLVEHQQIIGERSVHVPFALKFRRQESGKTRNPTGTQQSLQQLVAWIKLWHDDIFAIPRSCQRNVQATVDQFVSVGRQKFVQSFQQARLNVERWTEGTQRVRSSLVDDTKEIGCQFACSKKEKKNNYYER